MLWLLVLLLLLAWGGGFALNVGDAIHFLLVVAIAVALYNLFVSRGRTAL